MAVGSPRRGGRGATLRTRGAEATGLCEKIEGGRGRTHARALHPLRPFARELRPRRDPAGAGLLQGPLLLPGAREPRASDRARRARRRGGAGADPGRGARGGRHRVAPADPLLPSAREASLGRDPRRRRQAAGLRGPGEHAHLPARVPELVHEPRAQGRRQARPSMVLFFFPDEPRGRLALLGAARWGPLLPLHPASAPSRRRGAALWLHEPGAGARRDLPPDAGGWRPRLRPGSGRSRPRG
jgi:hypothetical protein